MPVLPTILARVAAVAALSASAAAQAGVIYLSQYGAETDHVITFSLAQQLAGGTAVDKLFAEQGVLFSGAARLNPCASSYYGYAGIRGNHVGTRASGCRTTSQDEQFSLKLARPVERFTMSLVASDLERKDQFTLLQGGAEVASFRLSSLPYYLGGDCADPLGCVLSSQARPQGYLVIDDVVFDELRFVDAGLDMSWLAFDNLGFDVASAGEAPEPPTPALVGAVLLALALASWRRP